MPSPRKTKSSRPFLSFLKTSPCKPQLSGCQSKELPLLPHLDPSFEFIGPPRPPPFGSPPPCPRSEGLRSGSRDEVAYPDYLFPSTRLGSPAGPQGYSQDIRLESPFSAVSDGASTPDNLFPPLRYGSQSDSPTQRPTLLKRPVYSPPQGKETTPDNLFPPLRFGSPSSPGGIHHAAHTRTGSSTTTPSRLRSATLQSPIKDSFTTPPQRLRSATVESSNTFGTCAAAPPRVIARDYASPPASRPIDIQDTFPTGSHAHRRRPSKLTLRTTNLSEAQPGETTPTPKNTKTSSTDGPYLTPFENPHPVSAITRRTRNARERRRSRSTGDLESLLMRQGNHRASRSESHKLAAFPVEVDPSSDTESREVYTPASMLSVTSVMSDITVSPDKPTGSRFDNVPLPWSTHPLSSLLPTLPDDYLAKGYNELLLRIPHLLAENTLLSLSSEEDRLQLELQRLKVKHTTLGQRRDKLVARLGPQQRSGDITSSLGTLQETVGRVDRVARQIYICNDQVRQMEVMKRDHEIGVLLWALEKARREGEELERRVELERDESRKAGMREEWRVDEGMPVPAIQLTRATLYEVEDHTAEDDGCEILNSPLCEEGEESYAEILAERDRPMSTVSIASGRFGFPIPPSRPSIIPPFPDTRFDSTLSPKTESHGHEFDDAETEYDYDSSFGHEPDLQAVNHKFLHPHNITIYPPSQTSYQSQTYPSSPHTPQGSTDSHSTRDHDRLPLPIARRLTPLSARRSKPDLTIPIPRRPSSRRPPPRQKETSPLRLAPPKSKSKAKTRSLQSNMDGLMVSGQEKFLRARESRLEDAESIMLSLVTAELWTKGLHSPGVPA